jgi:putative transposase
MEKKIIHKAYKFRVYPNKEQEVFIKKSCGSSRFVYNYFLAEKTKYYTQHKNDKKKGLTFIETEHLLTKLKKQEEYTWLNEVNSQSLQYALRNLDSAYKRFFNKLGDFPKFHKKVNGGSFTIPQFFKIVEETNKWLYLKIPKLDKPMKIRKSQDITGKILYIIISITPTGKYYASFTCKEEIELLENKKEKALGLDVGIKEFVFTSDNEIIQNDKNIKRKERRRKIKQRKLAKSKKGGQNRNKLRKQLAVKHEKETNVRKNFLHQVSNYIVKNQDIIITEDLNVRGMVRNHKLAKALSHQSFGEFFRQLEYKSDWNSKIFHKINRWFPSSKLCSQCGAIKENLKLSDRVYKCGCGLEIDRDYNASINIKNLGLIDLNIFTVGTTESYASGRVKITDISKIMSVNSNEGRIPRL